MKDKNTVQMYINIAGERISLNVGFDCQDDVREAEESVCTLYNKWKKQFPLRTERELLAMISYQFAYYYITLSKRYNEVSTAFTELEKSVESLLDGNPPASTAPTQGSK